MIKVSINEASDRNPIKSIHFSDSNGNCFRRTYFDISGKLIFDAMNETIDGKGVVSESLFVGENYLNIAFREYLRDENGEGFGSIDYELIDGRFEKISHTILEKVDSQSVYSRVKWYDKNGNLFYYTELHADGEKYFDSNNKHIPEEKMDEFYEKRAKLIRGLDEIISELIAESIEYYLK